MRLLIVGNPAEFHVGGHLMDAANELQIPCEIVDSSSAMGRGLRQKLVWRLADRRPLRQSGFCRSVTEHVRRFRPSLLLATGMCPLDGSTLESIGDLGVLRANFLTDDPFNPKHRSRWFDEALRHYDLLFTPRRSNAAELRAASSAELHYLPFAYNPLRHFPGTAPDHRFAGRMLFVGGADRDRVEFIRELVAKGIPVALYGGFWERHQDLRPLSFGLASQEELRNATVGAGLCLILVRRANRDGHVMRSFEAAASGGALVAEDTPEHRELFGQDGESVRYFRDPGELAKRATELLKNPAELRRMSESVRRRIVEQRQDSYANRLRQMIERAVEYQKSES
jgi:hypothetical protein